MNTRKSMIAAVSAALFLAAAVHDTMAADDPPARRFTRSRLSQSGRLLTPKAKFPARRCDRLAGVAGSAIQASSGRAIMLHAAGARESGPRNHAKAERSRCSERISSRTGLRRA